MASIDVVNARVTIGGRDLLAGTTLHVADGEAVAVLGPSGCGKTTLLRAIAGLVPLSGGVIAYDRTDAADLQPGARGVGMVFQDYALYPHMQSKGILGFYYQLRGRDAEVGDRVKGVCEVMGPDFEGLLERKPKELSGGQRQRVAIGRCIIREPRVFLFDEPLSALDARLRSQTRVEIKRLLRRFGVTAIYVSHDQVEAMAIGDRIAIMREGRIEQAGPALEVHARPRNTFVATFLGTPPMSLVAGIVQDGAVRLVGPGSEPDAGTPAPLADLLPEGKPEVARVPLAIRPSPPIGTAVILGWRPDAVRLAGAGEACLVARVMAIEPVVADRQVALTCATVVSGRDGAPATVSIRARARADAGVATGDRVRLAFDAEATHAFDAAGERLVAVLYSA